MKDLAQLAREAAYKAYGDGQSINGIAEAVLRVVVDRALDNHHNALTCPYCLPLEELRVALRDLDAATIVRAIEMYRDATKPLCFARDKGGFVCTLDPGHDGDHDASGCCTWPNQPNPGGALAGDGSICGHCDQPREIHVTTDDDVDLCAECYEALRDDITVRDLKPVIPALAAPSSDPETT